ncbi:MAG: hypothetical protein PHI52_10505 [Bacteroidales bacterium]|nr:hypothetical protein [Bacteroidales bacterium]MDD4644094.1 hypothetical protein [Bacilli bacterium]
MKRFFLCTLFVALLFFWRINTLALDTACTQAEKVRLRELVNATQITYEFYEVEDEDTGLFQGYKVSISNFKPDFYVYDISRGTYFGYSGDTKVTSDEFDGGKNYKFPFYASDGTPCEGYLIMTKSLQLIPYNPYSKDPLCVGHETYELCKKFTPIKITSDSDFKNRMNQYIKSLDNKKKEEPIIEKPIVKKTIWQSILSFLVNNYMIFLISIIILGTAGIVIIEVKRRRSIL